LITPDNIGNKAFLLYGSPVIFSFNQWISSTNYCGTFTYTITSGDGSPLDTSFINYSSVTRTFTVMTTDFGKRGDHQIKIVGLLGTTASLSYVFTVSVLCIVNTLTPQYSVANQLYTIKSSTL
jgi:hypothetical protein